MLFMCSQQTRIRTRYSIPYTVMKLLYSFFILSLLITTGVGQDKCSATDITVKQKRTGTLVRGKPEFEATLFNGCACPVTVRLGCNGFRTVEKIEPNVLVVNGGECSLPKGSFIAPFSGYVFSYAWDSQFSFKVQPNGATCV